MNRKLFILLLVLACSSLAHADWQESAKLTASDGNSQDSFGQSVSVWGNYCAVGAPENDANGNYSGAVYTFKRGYDPNWSFQQKVTSSDLAANDYFGTAVSIRDNLLIVGAPDEKNAGNNPAGAAYIFERSSSSWIQKDKLVAPSRQTNDFFGCSVSICDNFAVVGEYYDDTQATDAGAAHVFAPNETDPNTWLRIDTLFASDANFMDEFGYSVAVDGNYIIVGAPWDDDDGGGSGSAYIFTPNDIDPNNWVQQAKLTASDGNDGDNFGYSVGISGSYAIVGAPGASDPCRIGAAYIFTPNDIDPNIWDQQAKLTPSDGNAFDQFGVTVSIDGYHAAIGAPHHIMDETGIAYVFGREDSNWTERDKLNRAGGQAGDNFGYSVGISGKTVIVGVPGDDDMGSESGSAYMYERVYPVSDLSGDGLVNFIDFSIFAGQWLQSN